MPPDRAEDSYTIYSILMPIGELGNKDSPHDLWLLADTTTTSVSPNQPCIPPANDRPFASGMNPHTALHPTSEQAQDYAELLADFDLHCHERVLLTADGFHLPVPLKLLNKAEQEEFMSTRPNVRGAVPSSRALEKYKGYPGFSSFSEVYFNVHHDVAMVYGWGWCGGNCGQGYWAVFGCQNGRWKKLSWSSAGVMA